MRIACCTMEMVALIFLLFVSINGGYSYLNNPSRTDLVSKSTGELVSAWGEPDEIVTANDLGFLVPDLAHIEVWSYGDPVRSVTVRNDVVVAIRWG